MEGAVTSRDGYELISARSAPDYVEIEFFDTDLGSDLARVPAAEHATPVVLSADDKRNLHTVAVYGDRTGAEFFLLDREAGEVTKLGEFGIAQERERLADMRPIAFDARDGLRIRGYLTLPKGTAGMGLPMVLLVHGGPWGRSHWRFSNVHQFLASRGYAVLDLNYRGSTGYGRRFMEASRGEFARRMHTDLLDGTAWAVEQGIADADNVAIIGRSYGGYATLVGLSFTPNVFAAGVDIVGVSDLVSVIENVPPYWKLYLNHWHDFVGDPADPAQRKEIDARSPVYHLHAVASPLLVVQGANDVRVMRDQSDRVVEALRARGHPVECLLFENEGHAIRRWQNQIRMYRAIEDFLAEHLGGRAGPREWVELAARVF